MTAGAPRTSLAWWVVAALVVGLAVAALVAWLVWTTGGEGETGAAGGQSDRDAQADRADAGDDTGGACRWDTETLIVGGMTVPADCEHGPAEVDDGRLSGWSQTREGAAHAGAGLRITTGALAGPEVYRATIEEQTYGPDSERSVLLDDVEQNYAELDAEHGLDGGPFEGTWPRGQIQGYRVEDYSDNEATVWLLTSAQGEEVAHRVDLQWVAGDWQASVESFRQWREHTNRQPVTERFDQFEEP